MPRSRPPGPATPQGPSGPPSPGGPPKRSSRFGKRSKTKNIKCSEAASAWQLAIRRGGSPGSEVYKTLAQCRAGNKTAKAGMAAGTVAGAALAERAVTSRIDRSLATATSRKAELQARIRERAGRTISDADRQRANDIASRVSGNSGGPSAALKRLQGVRASRTRRSTSPAATVPPASRAATPAASTPRTRRAAAPAPAPSPSKIDRLRANAADRQSHRENHERERYIAASALTMLRQRGPAGRLEAKNLRRTAYNAVERRSPTGPDWSHSDADRAYMRTNERKVGRQNLMAYEVEARATESLRRVPPPMVGPKPPRVGLEAYRASRALRTQPGVAESRSAAARGLRALRQAGPAGRSDARAFQQLTINREGRATQDRGRAIVDRLVMNRQARGVNFNQRGANATDKAYQIVRGTFNPTDTLTQRRSAAATELAGLRRLRNASFEATGQRGPSNYWRDAASSVQVSNPNVRANLRGVASSRSITGANRTTAVQRANDRVNQAVRDNLADQQRAAAAAAAAQAAAAAPTPTQNAAGQTVWPAPAGGYHAQLTSSARVNSETHSPVAPRAANHHESVKAAHVNENRPITRHRAVGKTTFTASQLREARQQAGEIGNYAATSRHTAVERANFVGHAEATGVKLVGSTSDEKFNHLIALSGVHPAYGDRVHLSSMTGNVTINIPGGYRTLKTETNAAGKSVPMIYNAYYVPNGKSAANGQAIDQYSRSIVAARAAGVSHISVTGGGNGNGRNGPGGGEGAMTGYHAWPSYGFDGPIPSRSAGYVRGAHPDLRNVTNFSEAFFHSNLDARREARAAWSIHGGASPRVTLDLTDTNSVSYKNFSAHYAHTQRRSGRTLAQHSLRSVITRNGGYETPG